MDPSGTISQEEESDCEQSMEFRSNKSDRSLIIQCAIGVSTVKLKGVKQTQRSPYAQKLLIHYIPRKCDRRY